VTRACDRAFPHPTLAGIRRGTLTDEQWAELDGWRKAHRWHPHQLRHSAATALRSQFHLDVARIILGQSSLAVTELYAEADREKAIAAMARVG
jgi:integrase